MNRLFLLLFGAVSLVAHAQVPEVISNAPCVNIAANSVQNDVVVRLILPPLSELNVQIENIQLTNSSGEILPYFNGQNWADSSEIYVRFDTLVNEETIFFLNAPGYNHSNEPLDVFDFFDSFDSPSLDETLWSSSSQNGASFNLSNGELIMNVTQTDNYCSIYSNETFNLDQNWAILLQSRTEDNRGHVCMALGSGYDDERLNNGGSNQLNGYGLGEGHNDDWIALLRSDGNEFVTEYFGEDLTYSLLHASWTDNTFNILEFGELASTLEVDADEKPSGTYPFFIWLNGWDSNNRTLWLDFVAIYHAAEAFTQVTLPGCMDSEACNYNALAECEGEACEYSCCPGPGCCLEGTVWDAELGGCIPMEVTCPEDLDFDGVIGVNDLMQLLSSFGTDCTPAEEPETAEFACGDPINYHGYDYATVQIGEQCWFAENLRNEQYANGDAIPGSFSAAEWIELTVGAQAVYDQDIQNLSSYGRLYNSFAIEDIRGLCPNQWHIPQDGDWIVAELSLGMSEAEANGTYWRGTNQGLQMKSSENDVPAWNGSNSSGFSALPGGYRDGNSGLFRNDAPSNYWSATTADDIGYPEHSYYRWFGNSQTNVYRWIYTKNGGLSVRCVKD